MLQIAIRTDASYEIGTGHVMRCLTLAKALKSENIQCKFICRILKGNLIDKIRSEGFFVESLPVPTRLLSSDVNSYEMWAGVDWQTDASETLDLLKKSCYHWLVVDHYSLDAKWEKEVKHGYSKLMVIDDLENRPHDADLLVDQNLGKTTNSYHNLVGPNCKRLIGPRYSILRQEFKLARQQALASRSELDLKNILITFGGVDRFDITSKVLNSLRLDNVADNVDITIIMGATAPNLKNVQRLAEKMPWATKVLVNVSNMADYIAKADISICSVGGTTWERCCLGLPSILIPAAKHENELACHLHDSGAALNIGPHDNVDFEKRLSSAFRILTNKKKLSDMCNNASAITDGCGVDLIIQHIKEETLTI